MVILPELDGLFKSFFSIYSNFVFDILRRFKINILDRARSSSEADLDNDGDVKQ